MHGEGEDILLRLGKLAIRQTNQVARYVHARHKRYNANVNCDKLDIENRGKYRPRATARVVRVITIMKKMTTAKKANHQSIVELLISILTHREQGP